LRRQTARAGDAEMRDAPACSEGAWVSSKPSCSELLRIRINKWPGDYSRLKRLSRTNVASYCNRRHATSRHSKSFHRNGRVSPFVVAVGIRSMSINPTGNSPAACVPPPFAILWAAQ
jgi:hypothetical protein